MTDALATLAVGDSGPRVRLLHARLLDLDVELAHEELVAGLFGRSTRHAVITVQRRLNLAPNGVVDLDARREFDAADAQHFGYVVGRVLGPDEHPVDDIAIRAFDRDLRSAQLLGETMSSEGGYFLVRYDHERARALDAAGARAASGTGVADVFVQALQGGVVVFDPPVEDTLFNAPPLVSIVVRLAVRSVPDRTEYEDVVASIEPLLGEYTWPDLVENTDHQDVTFLAGETGFTRDTVTHAALAQRMAGEYPIPAEFFYAIFQQGSLARAEHWATLRPRLYLTVETPPGALFDDIVLLPEDAVTATVESACATYVVPARLRDELPEIRRRLDERRDAARAGAGRERQRVIVEQLGHVLSSPVADQLTAIIDADPLGDLGAVFGRLCDLDLVPRDRDADETHARISLVELLGDDADLIERARADRDISSPQDVHRLAALDADAWTAAIRAVGAAGDAESVARQAALLTDRMAARYPTTAIAARLAADPNPGIPRARAVADLLAAHPGFDLVNGNAAELAAPQSSEPDPGETVAAVRAVQRVYRLAPTYERMSTLLRNDLHSAAAVTALGKERFVREAVRSQTFTSGDALRTYAAATGIHAASLVLSGQLIGAAAATKVPALSSSSSANIAPLIADFPNMKSLFSAIDQCECSGCRSVHGAPAYLVDVLQFLGNRLVVDTTTTPPITVNSARDALLARRPDLAVTDLNCANTNTSMPYLDLVCELLEAAVAPEVGMGYAGPVAAGPIDAPLLSTLRGAGLDLTDDAVVYGPDTDGGFVARDARGVVAITPDGAGWRITVLRQTFGDDAEVAAAPEYVNRDAYTALADSKSCFVLPFDLAHRETRCYFAVFGVDRAELMARLEMDAPAVAAERLGLSDAQRLLVVTPDIAGQPTIWTTTTAPASDTLENVDTFVTRAGLSYTDLLDLIALPWVDGGQDLFVQHLDSSADLGQKRIANLDDAALDRIHRFVRLRTASGWSAATLDRALRSPAVGGGSLDDACLVAVAALADVAQRLGLAPGAALDLLEPLRPDDPAGVYAATFLDAVKLGSIDPRFTPAGLAANETAESTTPGSGGTLAEVADILGASLGTSVADTALLIATLGDAPAMTTSSLSAVYALSRLAPALGLVVAELTDLVAIVAADPLTSLDALGAFVEDVARLQASGMTAAEWRYLLRHEAADLTTLELADARSTAVLDALHSAYDSARESDESPFRATASPIENGSAVRPFVARLPGLSAAALATIQTVLDDGWSDPVVTEAEVVDAILGEYVDTAAIKTALAARAAAPSPTDAAANNVIAAVGAAVAGYLYGADRQALLVTTAASLSAVDEDMATAFLLGAHLKEPAAGSPLLNDVLLDDSTTPNTLERQGRALQLLVTMARCVIELALDAPTVTWLLEHCAALGWLELDHLPYRGGQPSVDPHAWRRLLGYLDLGERYPDVANPTDPTAPGTVEGFFDTVLAGVGSKVRASLAALTGGDVTTVDELDAHLGLSTPDPDGYRDPAVAIRTLETVSLLRTLGLDVPAAVGVADSVPDMTDALTMRLALKSRYAEAQWLGVLKQVQDQLREAKRDALVAYLLADDPGFRSVDDLYDHFLVDPEMTACMTTSRIVQAHATVQLFAQRCLMGLEPANVASVGTDDGWAQWSWMANFRVWEANRKIFLWPENWISPDLRDDKSELFVDLENVLQQDELTDLAVEDATGAYLEALDDIAHLDVMASYYDADKLVMHVFARTRGGSPAVYFHREFRHERYWTPWAKVPLDITDGQLFAFSRNSRLTLAWPVFTEEADASQSPPDTPDPASLGGGKANAKPRKRLKIQLAMSEHSGHRWREKRVSASALYTDFSEYPLAPEDLNFFVWTLGENQSISCFTSDGIFGSFALTGCKGLPEAQQGGSLSGWIYPYFAHTALEAGRFGQTPDAKGGELMVVPMAGQQPQRLFDSTPAGLFAVTYPLQMTLIDWAFVLIEVWAAQWAAANASPNIRGQGVTIPLGSLLPFFYGDYARGYALVPGAYPVTPDAASSEKDIAEPKKTASDVLGLIKASLTLATKHLENYKKNPGMSFEAWKSALESDPDYQLVAAEVKAYLKLRYGVRVQNFYHPLICRFRRELNSAGIPALMSRSLQLADTGFDFEATYQPASAIVAPYPAEDVDFAQEGAYSSYNWELFFHLPFDIATRLNQDQQFEAARDWYHYVFNPVGAGEAPTPNRYWNTKPFFQTTPSDYLAQRIDMIMNALAEDPTAATSGDLAFAVSQWRATPFRPDAIARSRPVAYQMAIVLNYVQNLIDWGDNLLRQFTRESVNQATQLYVLADKLLGPKPRIVPPAVPVPDMTYQQLRGDIDIFGNALLDLESLVPHVEALPQQGAELPPPPATLSSLYFCVPPNETMLAKWDLVADRLFKIRHCQNIDGIAASLALFSPPIDPGALARATAAGLDVSSFIAGLGAPQPHYRFQTMVAKATELTQYVAGLGAELLAALEKRDAEAMARLRNDQEVAVLDSIRSVKLATIDEARGARSALEKSREVIEERITFYSSQPYMNAWETTAVALNGISVLGEAAVALGYALAGGLKLVPNFTAGASGFGGSPVVTVATGGESIGGAAETATQVISTLMRIADKTAGMAATQGGYQRRSDEWGLQLALAQRELAALEAQLANADLHLVTLAKDLENHDLQAKNAHQMGTFMHSKYTNQELYNWTIGQISSTYHQAYQLAFDVAKKAERCYGYELASDAIFIKFGYWDSLKKGLMSADAMLHDIKRMESSYLDENAREYELIKHVSLAQLDPGALLQLKTTGKVTVQVPEVAFDLDHPGHYLRRIKSVSTSLVCNAGPYTTVGMTLSLVNNKYRTKTTARAGATTDKDRYAEDLGNDDRFAYNVGSSASIATSTAVSDSGLFDLNFHDDRYLPFEGAGAIGTWQIELPTTYQQFDHDTISDLILHIRYTAREGGSAFRTMTEKALSTIMNETVLAVGRHGLYLSFSVRDSFPNEWWQLSDTGSTSITIGEQHLPFFARSHSPTLTALTWAAEVDASSFTLTVDGTPAELHRDPAMTTLCVGGAGTPALGTPLAITCDPVKLRDLTILVGYTVT